MPALQGETGEFYNSNQDLSLKCSAWKGFIPRLEWKSPSPKQILCPKKFLGLMKYYGCEEILGPQKILILKNIWVLKKIVNQKKLSSS